MTCKDCIYSGHAVYRIGKLNCCDCFLTNRVVDAYKEHDCNFYNRDLSEYDICYNCKYYGGGGDWGLFCSHKDMYHHLGEFSDEPCERYEKKRKEADHED